MAVRLPLASVKKTFLHEFIDPYSYCGVASKNTSESSAVWKITRVEVLEDGNTIVGTAVGAWDNKENLIYT
jgi:hypothetical protein